MLNADANILIYHAKKEGDITMISVYVDDFLLVFKYRHFMDWIESKLKNEYNVKEMGEVKTIIGWQITRNLEAGTLKVDQSAFIRNLVKEENLIDCNSVNIPIRTDSMIKINKVDN